MEIETEKGTMKAETWGQMRHVAADPSGFNWRIDGNHSSELDEVIEALQVQGVHKFISYRSEIRLTNEPQRVVIEARDTMLTYAGTFTVLTAKGREQFLAVLINAASNPKDENFPKPRGVYDAH